MHATHEDHEDYEGFSFFMTWVWIRGVSRRSAGVCGVYGEWKCVFFFSLLLFFQDGKMRGWEVVFDSFMIFSLVLCVIG